jgi:hypothetical protein
MEKKSVPVPTVQVGSVVYPDPVGDSEPKLLAGSGSRSERNLTQNYSKKLIKFDNLSRNVHFKKI